MQTAQLKYDIISWITALEDKKRIETLYQWVMTQEKEDVSAKEIVPPRRKGSLTESYGFWAEAADAPFDETNYRDKLWQTERNVW
ncbi:hypothetical protein AGMMS50262_23940 [Bacteroidia bacterium]|nr:hypothetical protein AGMMS50262_23940 [Bacteroidia bacterium]